MTDENKRMWEEFQKEFARIQRQMLKEKLDLTKRKEQND
jgi:hypothetical protein